MNEERDAKELRPLIISILDTAKYRELDLIYRFARILCEPEEKG